MRTLLLLAFAASASAQQRYAVDLAWQDADNPAGTQYRIYRAIGQCSGNPPYAVIAVSIVARTYQDATVSTGEDYCYAVTALPNGTETAKSMGMHIQIPHRKLK